MQVTYAITRSGEVGPMTIVLNEADAHLILMLLRLHTEHEYILSEMITQIPEDTIEATARDMMVI